MKKYIITKSGITLTVDSDSDGAKIIIRENQSGGVFSFKLQKTEKEWLRSVLGDSNEPIEVDILGFFAVSSPDEINNILLTMDVEERAEILGAEDFSSLEQIVSICKMDDAWVVFYRRPIGG